MCSEGRNPDNFSFIFWEKRWLHKFILKFTDLYLSLFFRKSISAFLSLKPKVFKLLIVFDTYTAQWENFYQSSGKGDMDPVAYCSCTCWLVNQSHFWREKVMLVRDKKTSKKIRQNMACQQNCTSSAVRIFKSQCNFKAFKMVTKGQTKS